VDAARDTWRAWSKRSTLWSRSRWRRGVPPSVVFREAAVRFWNDPGIQEGRFGLPLLCNQIEQWARPDAPKRSKRGPVAAASFEDFDASGDDYAHLNGVKHG
jgi:hypothetical protein